MADEETTDQVRLYQAMTAEMAEAEAESNRQTMLQLERAMCDKFRVLREERGWSQKELAERVSKFGFECHQSTVAKLESGRRPLRVSEMYALAHAFSLPPGAVFFMAYSSEDPGGFDGLTRLLASEEEQRDHMREMLLRQVETTIDIVADHQARMNSLVDTMRRVASSDPKLADELARIEQDHAGRGSTRSSRDAGGLENLHDETMRLLRGEVSPNGEHQAEA